MTAFSLLCVNGPLAKFFQVIWHVVTNSHDENEMITSGSVSKRYEALDLVTTDTSITAELLIHDSDPTVDPNKYYYLEALNDHGRYEYNFELTLKPVTTTSEPDLVDDDDGKGLNVGAIVGLVIAFIFIICAIVILITFLYKQKKCCFKQRKTESQYFTTEQRDNETQNLNVGGVADEARGVAGEERGGARSQGVGPMDESGQYESRDEVDDLVAETERGGVSGEGGGEDVVDHVRGRGQTESKGRQNGVKNPKSYQFAVRDSGSPV